MGIRLLKNTASATESAEISDREYWQQEKEKAIWDLLIFFAAVVIVAIAVGTAAWFASNKEVSGNSMQVLTEVPKYVQISVGRTKDLPLNDDADLLVLSENHNEVQAPRETGDDSAYDWSNQVVIGNYYRFGRLIPASSDSGVHILFTPDAAGKGRKLKENARYYQADGKTDGDLKTSLSNAEQNSPENDTDTDQLMATAYAFRTGEEKSQESFWSNYKNATSWYNTNDDGYYVDIPIWLRTNEEEDVSLYVEGYITQKNGELETGTEDPDALYKAVRVALLKNSGDLSDQLVTAVLADTNGKAQNIIPLQDAVEYGSDDKSILDSRNYTVTRDSDSALGDDKLYGLRLTNTASVGQAGNYVEYAPYDSDSGNVVTLAAPTSGETGWGEAAKLVIRIWLDGEDKDCWNETAGQDWSIHLRFVRANTGEDGEVNP